MMPKSIGKRDGMADDRHSNFWFSRVAAQPERPRLQGHIRADVVIVGAGFTGLWSAYYLKRHAPELDIVMLEAERVGHGASGRNGGWAVGNMAGLERYIGSLSQEEKRECCQLLADNVDEIGRVLARERIAADFHKGGAIYAAARYPDQIAIQRDYLSHLIGLGHSENDCLWLDADQLADNVRMHRGFGGIFHRQVATVNPARLATGLAKAVEHLGVTLHERTPALSMARGEVSTHGGGVAAPIILCATEGYAAGFHDFRKHIIPVQSAVIATEPLDPTIWQEIGLADRPAFADASRIITYGHRTADDRLVFGARGTYRLGGKPKTEHAISEAEIRSRHALLADLFPILSDVKITHGWGGSLGISRSFRPHAIVDRRTGIATAGGYAGEGVAASHLFGRTLADLILERETPLTAMPWAFGNAGHSRLIKRWEPEPLRWLAAQAITYSYAGEEALMKRNHPVPFLKPALSKLNDAFASIIE